MAFPQALFPINGKINNRQVEDFIELVEDSIELMEGFIELVEDFIE